MIRFELYKEIKNDRDAKACFLTASLLVDPILMHKCSIKEENNSLVPKKENE